MGEGVLHSPIGASSMYRWSACPGSVNLSKGIEKQESSYAAEGTAAHEWAAKVLMLQCEIDDVPEDYREAVKIYEDLMRKEGVYKLPKDHFLIEQSFNLDYIHKDAFGTADAVAYFEKKKLLKVYDYKHGSGIAVEAVFNKQLMYYALGALMSTEFKAKDIEVVIVQPRCEHPDGRIRRWQFPVTDILDFASDLQIAALKTEEPDAPLVSGEHCRFCPAAGFCPELFKQSTELAVQEFSKATSYDPDKLSNTLKKLHVVEAWIKSVREFAYQEAIQGRCPPGFKLVNKRPMRKWADEKEVISYLMDCLRLEGDAIFNIKLKSPAQIDKLVGRTYKKDLHRLMVKESSGMTLAPISDSREEASQSILELFNDDIANNT